MDIRFEQGTITGYALSGVLAILLTVVFVIVWKVRTKAKAFPIFIGAATFVLFAEILKVIPLYPLMLADNDISRRINSTPWMYYLTAALAAGIFEETGRYLAFRFVLNKYTERRTALDYGVGHGGIEAVITSLSMLSAAMIGTMVNNGMIDQIMASVPQGQQERYIEQISGYASRSFAVTMLWIPERAAAVMIHMALSVLVFRAVRDRKIVLFPIAAALHTLVDFCMVLYNEHPAAAEILVFVMAAAGMAAALRLVYRKMPLSQEVSA